MQRDRDLGVYKNQGNIHAFGALAIASLSVCALLAVPAVNTAVATATLRTAQDVVAAQLRCARLRAEAVPSQMCGVYFDTARSCALVFVDSPSGNTERFVPGEDAVFVPARQIPGTIRLSIPQVGGLHDCVVIFGPGGRVERGGRWELCTVNGSGGPVRLAEDAAYESVSIVAR